MKFRLLPLCGIAVAAVATPAIAQDGSGEDSVFDGDYLSVGIGGAYGPSYDGSDDYVFSPIPLIQGSLGGVDINPRGAGLALDFIPGGDKVDIDMGIAGRLRFNRARQIKDPVVEAAGKLDTAVEVGPTAGISFSGVLNPYDSISFNTDALWDVAGAHDGMTINPSLTYFTPFSRGIAGSLSVSGEYGNSDFNDYYYSVNAAQANASGLPLYQAHSGFTKVNTSLLLGVDLDGNLENGGFALFAVGNYSRMLNDAKDSPYTSIRGSADQWFGAFGIGYTF